MLELWILSNSYVNNWNTSLWAMGVLRPEALSGLGGSGGKSLAFPLPSCLSCSQSRFKFCAFVTGNTGML